MQESMYPRFEVSTSPGAVMAIVYDNTNQLFGGVSYNLVKLPP